MGLARDYKEAYEGGASIRQIALIYGKATSTIHYHLKKQKVEFRPCHKGEPRREEGKCAEGHSLAEHGCKPDPRTGYVQCQKCKREDEYIRYNTDDDYKRRRNESNKRSRDKRKAREALSSD